MTYTQDDFERDYKCVELACEDSDWKYGPCGIPPTLASVALKRIIDAYRDLQAENDRLTVLKRIIAAYRDQWKARAEAAEAENERLKSEAFAWQHEHARVRHALKEACCAADYWHEYLPGDPPIRPSGWDGWMAHFLGNTTTMTDDEYEIFRYRFPRFVARAEAAEKVCEAAKAECDECRAWGQRYDNGGVCPSGCIARPKLAALAAWEATTASGATSAACEDGAE